MLRLSALPVALLFLSPVLPAAPQADGGPLTPVPFPSVRLEDRFFAPRIDVNRRVTVRTALEQCERTGRLANFARAGGLEEGDFQGLRYDDSDVFKLIEGASYSLATADDPELERELAELALKIAAAQEEDGYLYTARTLGAVDDSTGHERWSYLEHSHELYNLGHLFEAAVAHNRATGDRTLLDVALRAADLVAATFGTDEGRIAAVPGHEEIELGLLRLYRLTGDPAHLELARTFVDLRGRDDLRDRLYGEYAQDHLPVVQQSEAVGHAVRAGYLYAALADLAALTGEQAYATAVDRIWEDVVGRRLYLTGGIGDERSNEGFGAPWHLPNRTAYAETCAAIANALWNQRMFLLHADARYLDVLERTLYNGLLSGVSLTGDRFFYPNPLACDGRFAFNHGSFERQEWFRTSCCPVNVVRVVPAVPGMVYATRGDELFVGLYAAGTAELEIAGVRVQVRQLTDYPWGGDVRIELEPEEPVELALALRVPGWALGRPVPSDLYGYADPMPGAVQLTVNGKPAPLELERGFAVVRHRWEPGDAVELLLPMPVRRVLADERVEADRGLVALERGPLVFCFEALDNEGVVRDLVLPDDAPIEVVTSTAVGGAVVLSARARRWRRGADGAPELVPATARAVPYALWANRGVGEMAVWLPRDEEHVELPPPPTLASRSRASASHCCPSDTVTALNDRIEPASSADHDLLRFTWWDRVGTTEWVQYDLPGETEISSVAVFWFDDTDSGRCRVPASWRLLWRDGDAWREVEAHGTPGVEQDAYNELSFEPVTTTALRIEAVLREGFSGGILEWRL